MNNNERELVQLSAKAAGIKLYWRTAKPYIRPEMEYIDEWNPVRYDADAFSLVVKLRMDVGVYFTDTRVTADDVFICEYHGVDPEGATRLAIVKAAAEIGRNMK